jgi:hypothetical protein
MKLEFWENILFPAYESEAKIRTDFSSLGLQII